MGSALDMPAAPVPGAPATPGALDPVALARLYGEPLFALPADLYIPPDALEVFLEAFEGPLDLLLYLIRKQNFNILDIPMVGVTRQYLVYVDEIRVQASDLQAAWHDILKRARLVQHHRITREELSVREYMSQLLKALQGRRFAPFEALFDPAQGSTVLIVTFIALLELAKETLIEITQAEAFAPIYVRLAYTPA